MNLGPGRDVTAHGCAVLVATRHRPELLEALAHLAFGNALAGAAVPPEPGPDREPFKLYHRDFEAPREHWGGDVWVHLRAFRKRLFDAVPHEALRLDGRWIEQCTDYATMIPIVELSTRPTYVREYLYFHERFTPSTEALREEKDAVIRKILEKPRSCVLPRDR